MTPAVPANDREFENLLALSVIQVRAKKLVLKLSIRPAANEDLAITSGEHKR